FPYLEIGQVDAGIAAADVSERRARQPRLGEQGGIWRGVLDEYSVDVHAAGRYFDVLVIRREGKSEPADRVAVGVGADRRAGRGDHVGVRQLGQVRVDRYLLVRVGVDLDPALLHQHSPVVLVTGERNAAEVSLHREPTLLAQVAWKIPTS